MAVWLELTGANHDTINRFHGSTDSTSETLAQKSLVPGSLGVGYLSDKSPTEEDGGQDK